MDSRQVQELIRAVLPYATVESNPFSQEYGVRCTVPGVTDPVSWTFTLERRLLEAGEPMAIVESVRRQFVRGLGVVLSQQALEAAMTPREPAVPRFPLLDEPPVPEPDLAELMARKARLDIEQKMDQMMLSRLPPAEPSYTRYDSMMNDPLI